MVFFEDSDGDGYGNPTSLLVSCYPLPPGGFVDNELDCDDSNALVNPEGVETADPDGLDNDCNGLVDDYVSVKDLHLTLKTYPNPVRELLNIDLDGSLGALEVKIITMDGRVLTSHPLQGESGKATLSFSGLPQGVYMLQMVEVNGSRTWLLRVVKQ